jgi:uncharacterized protein (DUF433 family)
MNIGELIVRDAGICGGRARIAGHRIAVFRVALAFRAGSSPEEMLLAWPSLSLAEIHAAIAYSLANATEIDADIAGEDRAWAEAEELACASR